MVDVSKTFSFSLKHNTDTRMYNSSISALLTISVKWFSSNYYSLLSDKKNITYITNETKMNLRAEYSPICNSRTDNRPVPTLYWTIPTAFNMVSVYQKEKSLQSVCTCSNIGSQLSVGGAATRTATWSGVSPSIPATFTSAPWLRSRMTQFRRFLATIICNAVLSWKFLAFKSQPCSIIDSST